MYDRNLARFYAHSCGVAAGFVFWALTIGGVAGELALFSSEFTSSLFIAYPLIGLISGYVLSRILLAQKYSLLCLVQMEEKTQRVLVG